MTHTDQSRAESAYQDRGWYWVEREGWGSETIIAPAMYKAECDAWYSVEFSGSPTREVKVLEPIRRATTEQSSGVEIAAAPAMPQWLPIESAPKNKTLLLGHRNSHGHWRTLRGEWFSREEIDELWEEPDGVEPGWFETSVEADDVPNVWRTEPTHWMPLPQPPKVKT